MIYTAILKPTKECNAQCEYCCTPPDGIKRWTIEKTQQVIDKLLPHMSQRSSIVFHGGEPMMMGPDYYYQINDYIKSKKPDINIGIQTNLLLYKSSAWKDLFLNVFSGGVSTSYEPDNHSRILNGSSVKYANVFFNALEQLIDDGIKPLVIGTFSSLSLNDGMRLYEFSINRKRRSFHIRLNYQYPMGRIRDTGPAITPVEYGEMLIDVYNRWIVDAPSFIVTPLNQMLKICLTGDNNICPWTNSCGGQFVSIDPDGSTYNCGLFSDMHIQEYCFGNIFKQPVNELLASPAARNIRRRRVNILPDCSSCRHFSVCQGGCARDSVLFNEDLYGKFYYCKSWKMVFDRIKESIRTGEADEVIGYSGLKNISVSSHEANVC